MGPTTRQGPFPWIHCRERNMGLAHIASLLLALHAPAPASDAKAMDALLRRYAAEGWSGSVVVAPTVE